MVLTDIHAVEPERRDVDHRERPSCRRFYCMYRHDMHQRIECSRSSVEDRGLPGCAAIDEIHFGRNCRIFRVLNLIIQDSLIRV